MLLAVALQVVVAADATQPQLAAVDGALHAVFLRNGNIEISSSSDQGKTWSPPAVAIDAKGRARGGMQRGPRIAVDAGKTLYVTAPLTFDDAEFQKRYPTSDLYLATSVDGGKTFSKPVMVNDVPKKAPEALHWLAAAGDVAYVAWLDLRAREKGQDLYLAKITEKGKKIAKNVGVAKTLCECCAPGLAVDPKGNPVLAYRDGQETADRPIYLLAGSKTARLNTAGTRVSVCPMDAPAVAVSRDGKIAAAWMDMRGGTTNRDVQWSFQGGAESTVHDDAAGAQGHPSLVWAEGKFWCAWEDGRSGPNSRRIYAADSVSKKNVALSEEGEGKCAYPALAANGAFVGAVYESPAGVSFRILAK